MKQDLRERYVYDVTRRLPESMREEVAKELRANMDDMLPQSPSEEDVVDVLKTLGHPRNLANEYRGTKRYLIAPEWMDDYLRVLKVVLIVFCTISLVFGLMENLKAPEADSPFLVALEVFAKTLSNVIDSAFRAFGIVTLVFAAIHLAGQKCKTQENWDPKHDLPQVPEAHVVKINRAGSVAELIVGSIFGVIWLWLLYHHSQYLGWWEGGVMLETLFSETFVQTMLPLYLVSFVLGLSASAFKLGYGEWNPMVAAFHTFEQVFSIVVMFTFVRQQEIFTPEILQRGAELFQLTATELNDNIIKGLSGFFVFLSLMIGIDLIMTWVKALRGKKKSQ
jgi:hypothetical protein